MSQKKSQKLQRPQQNWRGDADIISMETRILPKNLVPSFSKRVPQVQIPLRTASQSSATTPTSAVSLFSSWKRRQSSDSAMDPTPSKRHRVDLIVPKSEPDDSVTAALPYGHAPSSTATQRVGSNAAESEASSSTGHRPETTSPEPANQSYVHGLGTEMIYFRFGGQILPSSIHRKVLCGKVPAFKEELTRLQPNQNILDFPEGEGETFEALVEWAYTSKLPEVTKSTSPEQGYVYVKLYCLAAKYRQVYLMNDCIDYIVRYLKKGRPRWDVEWCQYAYANTTPGSPLRVLVCRWFMHKMADTKDGKRWTTEQFYDVARAQPDIMYDFFVLFRTMNIEVDNPRKDDSSIYHLTEEDLSLPPEFEGRTDTPLTVHAVSPDAQSDENGIDAPAPVAPTPPTSSDDDMEAMYEDKEDKGSTFDEDAGSSESEVVNDHLPLTRSSKKKSRYAKRALTAPA